MSEKIKVLVVEDNDFVRMQIVNFLQGDGYDVAEATEGEGALGVIAQSEENFSLAVVDIRMEPMGGFEFVHILRGRDIDVPVVFVTGDDTTDVLQEAGKLGVSAVLMKPVAKDRLLQVVRRVARPGRQGQR